MSPEQLKAKREKESKMTGNALFFTTVVGPYKAAAELMKKLPATVGNPKSKIRRKIAKTSRRRNHG